MTNAVDVSGLVEMLKSQRNNAEKVTQTLDHSIQELQKIIGINPPELETEATEVAETQPAKPKRHMSAAARARIAAAQRARWAKQKRAA